jgi:photosystem II stability/assembly factor-like uncharacterized protein
MGRMRVTPLLLLSPLLWAPAALAQDASPLAAWRSRQEFDRASPFAGLRWRPLGPRFCGGRIESIAVPAQRPYTIYAAPGSGNLFRSRDGGLSWTALFDHEATCAIGHVEVAPSDPDVVWVGTGEAHLGGMSFDGAGVYRSDDGGDSWRHVGLDAVGRIGKVRVHPDDADTAWVAAIGPRRGGPADARGVFLTTDGGGSWRRTLACEDGVAAIDLVLASDGGNTLFAATWDRAGGDRSGVHRSTDGGRTWERLGADRGLPVGNRIQRVAVDASRSAPGTVYALLVDDSKPGDGRYGVGGVVYRSDDRGATWTRCHDGFLPTYVGWDFCDVKVAPDDPDTLFVCGMKLIVSRDGGRTWREVGERVRRLLPFGARGLRTDEILHLDAHDLWIDPVRADRMLLGNDGGLFASFDRGDSWLHLNVLPIAEFYTVHVEQGAARPYRIWGGTQDNASVTGPAAVIDEYGGETWRHVFLDQWAGGDGFVTLPDPTDAAVVYFEHQNGDMRRKRVGGSTLSGADDVRIRPRGGDLRFAWNTPLSVSAHDPRRLYCAAQHVFRSDDRGDSWRRIGDDLGGGAPLVAIAESPQVDGLLYAGRGDGLVHVTVDGGAGWTRAAALPAGQLHRVVASRHAADRVYACVAAAGGQPACVQVSEDRGASWRDVSVGLPAEPVRVLLEDPRDGRVLYLGTEGGVCVSRDGGASWASLSATLPTAIVMDLAFQADAVELVAATHGRGLFVLDVSGIGPTEGGD